MKKIIIIGASSGIGKGLAEKFSREGWIVGLSGRRLELLEDIKSSLPHPAFTRKMDITDLKPTLEGLKSLIEEMGGMDVLVINSGIGNRKPSWQDEHNITQVNAVGFVSLARFGFDYFAEQGEAGRSWGCLLFWRYGVCGKAGFTLRPRRI